MSHVGGCLLFHFSLPSFLFLLNTKLGELLVCLLPLLLKPPFALLPLDLLVGCVQTRQAGVSELEDWVPSISTLSWEGMLVRGRRADTGCSLLGGKDGGHISFVPASPSQYTLLCGWME